MNRQTAQPGSTSVMAMAALVVALLAFVVAIAAYLRAGRLAAAVDQAGTTLDIRIDGQSVSPPAGLTLTDTITKLPDAVLDQAIQHAQASPPAAEAAPPPVPAPAPAPRGEPYIVDAGRSPLPQEGETVTSLIPPPQLEAREATAPEPKPGQIIPWSEAPAHFGREITIEGKVIDTGNASGRIAFLNFSPDRQSFYVVIFDEAFDAAPDGRPDPYFLDKTVRVTGEVSAHRGRPQIKVNDKAQITVVE